MSYTLSHVCVSLLSRLHPMTVQLGLQYMKGVICGSNARAIALLCLLKQVGILSLLNVVLTISSAHLPLPRHRSSAIITTLATPGTSPGLCSIASLSALTSSTTAAHCLSACIASSSTSDPLYRAAVSTTPMRWGFISTRLHPVELLMR